MSSSDNSTDARVAMLAARLERSIAFFGAVDTRPHLFLQSITLQSVRRFHPASGYFVLLPEAKVAKWRQLLSSWSSNGIRAIALPESLTKKSFVMPPHSSYSTMTFHRHWVPEMLFALGYKFSVNLDPDVFCTRPWELRTLLRVKLLGGRLVGTNARTAKWLQMEHSNSSDRSDRSDRSDSAPTATGTVSGGASRQVGDDRAAWMKAGENVTSMLRRVLGVTPERLAETRELNGGVLVFNNAAAARVGWGKSLARYHATLRHVVEGDQDLIGLMMAAEPNYTRFLLPTTYNYAYRRDRERLPYAISHRLRHGLVEQQIINVHFVVDGKPWQQQRLAAYPLWLLSARLHHLRDWLTMARAVRPQLDSHAVAFSASERALLGEPAFEALRMSTERNSSRVFLPLVDSESHRRCRCFMRSLSKDKKADAVALLTGQPKGKGSSTRSSNGRVQNISGSRLSLPASVASAARLLVRRQRQSLLLACGSQPAQEVSDMERRQCDEELGARAALFSCALSQSGGAGKRRSAAGSSQNCTRAISAARDEARSQQHGSRGEGG